MKTKSLAEQKGIARDIFKLHPKANKLAITSDGTGFIVDNSDNAAKNHAKNNSYDKELKIEYFTRDEIMQEDAPKADGGKPKTADELIADINAADTAEAIEAIRDAEANGKNRTTVIAAADKRIFELSKADE